MLAITRREKEMITSEKFLHVCISITATIGSPLLASLQDENAHEENEAS
jgi:hypothetical protein